jgi:CPA1 family monovalent cation:H+ antiporter
MSKLELISLMVTTAAVFGWVSRRWLKLPITIGTMLLTVIASLILLAISAGHPAVHTWAMGLVGAIDFENLILHGMLPLLLFAGSFLLDLEALGREKLLVTLLSLPGTLLAAAASAGLMGLLLPAIGLHTTWLACLFFGALISPTDPIAVLELLRRVGVPRNIQAQLAGESLFNDGVGAVLFIALLEASRGTQPTFVDVAGFLILKAGGGLILGIALAFIASSLMRAVDAYQVEILMTIALALGGYALAERLSISAPLEAVAAGIALRRFNLNHRHAEIAHESLDRFWEVIDEVQNAVLFVLLGLMLLAIPFSGLALRSGGVAIVAVTLVRFATVAFIVGVMRTIEPGYLSSIRTLSWGGLRGGLSLALALAVPLQQGRNWILVATYSVVLFSIVVQGGSMDVMLGKLKIKRPRVKDKEIRSKEPA